MESISSQFVYFLGVAFCFESDLPVSYWEALRGKLLKSCEWQSKHWIQSKERHLKGVAISACVQESPDTTAFRFLKGFWGGILMLRVLNQTLKPASFLKYHACQVSLVSHGPVSTTRGNTWNCAIYGNHSVDALAGVNEGIAEGACCVENVQRMLNTLAMNHRATFC